MKNSIIIIILSFVIIFFIIFNFTKNNNRGIQNIKNDEILQKIDTESIKLEVKNINSVKNFEIITLDSEKFFKELPDGGIKVEAFIKDKEIYKIIQNVGLSYGILDTEYYFLNGQIIYITESENYFPDKNSDGQLEYNKLDFGFRTEYFFENEVLVDVVTKGEKRFKTEDNLQIKLEKDMLNSATGYFLYFKEKMYN